MLRFLRNNKGLFFLEILFATALLGITAEPFLGGLNHGIEGIFSASRRTVATELASAELEKQLSVWAGANHVNIPPREETSRANYPGYIIVREAVLEEGPINGGNSPNLYKITITVKWQEHGEEEEVRLASFLSER